MGSPLPVCSLATGASIGRIAGACPVASGTVVAHLRWIARSSDRRIRVPPGSRSDPLYVSLATGLLSQLETFGTVGFFPPYLTLQLTGADQAHG